MGTVRTYSQHTPTQFDHHLAIDTEDGSTREDWLLVPVSRTRDSGCFDESNFAAALDMLGGESDTVEVHRFGHWGPGWYEIIIAHPSRVADVEAIAASLEGYPLLDDDDHSRREWEAQCEDWESYGCRDFARFVAGELGMTEESADRIPEGALLDFYRDSGSEYSAEPGEGFHFYLNRSNDRAQLARLIVKARRAQRAVPRG